MLLMLCICERNFEQGAAGSPFGVGSDIGGSIRMPAFFNGVFGHKPSSFIVSNKGQWPIPVSKEHLSFLGLGPMSRFACDLKPMLKILADQNAEQLALDEPVNPANIKYFYQETDGGSYFVSPVDNDIRMAMDKVIRHLQNALNVKPQRVQLPKLKQSTSIWLANMKDENVPGFDSQLANLDGRINPYVEMLKWLVGMSKHTFIGIMTAITGVCYTLFIIINIYLFNAFRFCRTPWDKVRHTRILCKGQRT